MKDIPVFCADIGSIKQRNFGWFAFLPSLGKQFIELSGSDITEFVSAINQAIKEYGKASIGFECPLFIPIPENPLELTSARPGEGSRAWSTSAGAIVLSIGLNQTTWIFREIAREFPTPLQVTFNWQDFIENSKEIHIWEAFVTGKSKTRNHMGDAELAAREFLRSLPNPETSTAIQMGKTAVLSLAGVSLLRSGLSRDLNLLSNECTVIKSFS